jgi:hypothetical protein
MKNFTLSFEGLLLIILLLAGIYGARVIMQDGEESSPGFASPRQESPAMVMAPDTPTSDYPATFE